MTSKNIKIIGWNVNGFNSITQKGELQNLLQKENPDILCLQELKCDQIKCQKLYSEQDQLSQYEFYNFSAQKPGYSGVGILTKIKPNKIQEGIPNSFGKNENDKEIINTVNNEGRIQIITFKKFTLINIYVPNSQPELKRLEFRLQYDRIFREYIHSLKIKNLIITGDYNCAHQEIDIARPKQNTKNAGFSPQERESFQKLLDQNLLTNAFRYMNGNNIKYTYWSYLGQARKRNVGWHIDYFLVSQYYIKNKKILISDVLDKVMGSDHAPIILQFKI